MSAPTAAECSPTFCSSLRCRAECSGKLHMARYFEAPALLHEVVPGAVEAVGCRGLHVGVVSEVAPPLFAPVVVGPTEQELAPGGHQLCFANPICQDVTSQTVNKVVLTASRTNPLGCSHHEVVKSNTVPLHVARGPCRSRTLA